MEEFGIWVASLVLTLADLVKLEFAPGLVVFLFTVGLLIAAVRLYLWQRKYRQVVDTAIVTITSDKKSKATEESQTTVNLLGDFYGRRLEMNKSFGKMEDSSCEINSRLGFSWREYQDTLVADDEQKMLMNGIRPNAFFNSTDLGAEPGFFRLLPGLFVSLGLAFTFLGLIAALQQTGTMLHIQPLPISGDTHASTAQDALSGLLDIASAKFIMSLWGLVCSIIFTVCLRIGITRVHSKIEKLCMAIEHRVRFVGLETLTLKQIQLAKEQKEHAQKLTTQLIAEIGKPLREELPQAISASIAKAIEPVLERVGQAGTAGVEAMTQDLAGQFSGEIATAIGSASTSFDVASQRIEHLADSLMNASGRVNTDMEATFQKLAVTMEDMQAQLNTGAQKASDALTGGVDSLLQQMNGSLGAIRDTLEQSQTSQHSAIAGLTAAADSIRQTMQSASADAEAAIAQRGNALNQEMDATFQQMSRTMEDMQKQAHAGAHEARDTLAGGMDSMLQQMNGSLGIIRTTVEQSQASQHSAIAGLTAAADSIRQSMQSASADAEAAIAQRSNALNQEMDATFQQMSRTMEGMQKQAHAGAHEARDTLASGMDSMLHQMNGSLGVIQSTVEQSQASQHSAIAGLTAAADSIRQTMQSASADAATAIAHRGDALKQEMEKQSAELADKLATGIDSSLQPSLAMAETLTHSVRENLVMPIQKATESLERFAGRMESGTTRFGGFAEALKRGVDAADLTADSMVESSSALAAVVSPIKQSVDTLEKAVSSSSSIAKNIGISIESQRTLVEKSLESVNSSLVRFQDVVERYDQIDENLGAAFKQFRDQVEHSIGTIQSHSDGVHKDFADALNVLKNVVDQAEQFRPAA